MSAAGEAMAEEDTHASGAKPRPEGRAREQGWRPTNEFLGYAASGAEAARRCAIEERPTTGRTAIQIWCGGRE